MHNLKVLNPEPSKFALTQSQQLIYTGQKLNPESPLYNVPYAFRISGSLAPDIFIHAFQLLIVRYDSLRITFEENNNVVEQIVWPAVDHIPEIINYKEKPSEIEIETYLIGRSQRIFELTKLLFDCALLQIDQEECIWYLNLHHLITDAGSVALLFNDMAEIYQTLLSKREITFPDPPSFVQYLAHEKESRSAESIKHFEEYWKNGNQDSEPVGPFYGNTINNLTTYSDRVLIELDEDRANLIRGLSQQQPYRMFSPKLAIYNIFASALTLYSYLLTGQGKLSLGSPVHNRDTHTHSCTSGLLMEVYPLFAEIRPQDSVQDLINRMKTRSFDLLSHVQTGLVNAQISRGYNILLNYIPWSFGTFNGKSVRADWLHPGHCDPNHHMRCQILDPGKGGMQLIFDLNRSVFPKDKHEEVARHYLNILDAVTDDVDRPVNSIEIVRDKDKAALLARAESSSGFTDKINFLDAFENKVVENGNKNALICDERSINYDSLNRKANQLAHFMRAKGVKEGDKVGILLQRSIEYITSLLATMKLGAVFVPIASDTPSNRVQFILNDSDCSLYITNEQLISKGGKRITSIDLNSFEKKISESPDEDIHPNVTDQSVAYHLYTSGSTGNPKGVIISRGALDNYLNWASRYYDIGKNAAFPLFTSVGFDLTISSTLLPLMNGGCLYIYPEAVAGPDMSLFKVLADNKVNCIKLTPSHLSMIQGRDLSASILHTVIVGGEEFKTYQADELYNALGGRADIFNEYGPTEATVGSVIYKFKPNEIQDNSLPIGVPICNMQAYVLNDHQLMVPEGVIGELYLAGKSLANGYYKLPDMDEAKFLENPFQPGSKMYRTGDLVRWNEIGQLEFLGRSDDQIKFNGYRVELSDIEANLLEHPAIQNAAVVLMVNEESPKETHVENCMRCGLPSNYPSADFDVRGICHLCNAFEGYKAKVNAYFKTEQDLQNIFRNIKENKGEYDCLSLLSGGKDSTYVLARLVGMGLKVLAFTLDNGYISDQAKENIKSIVKKLGVDHIYGETTHMNEIFVDSLYRHSNVCNGCFKTIYTLSTKVALEKNIPFIVTGLSRGQFFETRLTEELFWEDNDNSGSIDQTILEARKLYHREQDAIKDLLDVSMFEEESTFERVQFVDFYRYSQVTLQEMLLYLKEKVDWKRPTDTGRSTNCLINQLGIHVHKKEKGYSNYAFPYSWDVRLGHKLRDESLEEINEVIDEKEVMRMMEEIGYEERAERNDVVGSLVAYYVGEKDIEPDELIEFLRDRLPAYMIPGIFKRLDAIPITKNGKTDKNTLKELKWVQLSSESSYMAPRNDIEALLEEIWKEVLRLKQVGVFDNFISLGGHSLAAIRITARINEELQLNFQLNKIFDLPSIAEYASYIESTLLELMDEQ